MSKIDLTSKEWNDLIFEGRNKAYGGYNLRLTSDKRHIKALIIVALLTLMVLIAPALIKIVIPRHEEVKMTEVTTLSNLAPVEEKQPERPIDVPPPPPLKSTIKFTAPVIKKDEEVPVEEEMKDQKDILSSKVTVSIADVKGTDEEKGKDIAEVKDILQDDSGTGTVYNMVEQMPQFPGGEEELMKFVAANLQYPAVAQELGIQGRVIIRFVVTKDGEVTDVEVMRGLDPTCDKEALRVVKAMPKWIPGKQNGKNVPVYFTLPVLFQMTKK